MIERIDELEATVERTDDVISLLVARHIDGACYKCSGSCTCEAALAIRPRTDGNFLSTNREFCFIVESINRDEVWDVALRRAAEGKSSKVEDIADNTSLSVDDKIISRTLDAMSEYGWLSKRGLQMYRWAPGPIFTDNNIRYKKDQTATPVTEVQSLSESRIYSGKVDRMSSNANAIITLPSHHNSDIINLGPINSNAVGERVEFEFLGSQWGRCITKKYIDDGYRPRSGASPSHQSSGSRDPNPYQFTTMSHKNGLLNNKNTDS